MKDPGCDEGNVDIKDGYTRCLLCLGHLNEKFSSFNKQPASVAHV